MYPQVISLGEALVEIMRKDRHTSFTMPGSFVGPFPSGAPAIFISGVARLSNNALSTGFIGVTGNDDFSHILIQRLTEDRVDISHIRKSSLFTGTAFIRYLPDGSRKFIFHPGAAARIAPSDIQEEYFSKIALLHITGSSLFLSNSSCAACEKALDIALQKKAIISFDPNIRPEMALFSKNIGIVNRFLEKSDLLFATEEEMELLSNKKNVTEACKDLLAKGVSTVIIKKGKEGSEIITAAQSWKIPSLAVKVQDPTGAGDTYAAGFVAGFLQGKPLPQCGLLASYGASLKCTRQGPMSIPSLQEVEVYLKK
ncbi:MAG: sugar kinase [Candidatus Ratteibacteria bacterium]|jgi:sugar/nucleoside kinase (ribokinase family)